ncbi:MAG TPA: hypothetical protein VMA53_03765 [Stellaceae bacterium]|nr:hypothetical protein [Stellaceae bacterium]
MRPVVAPLALAAVILAAAPASAAMLGDSSLSYHAWRTVTVDGRQYSGPAYHEKGHERHEQDLLGMRGVFLLDDVTAQGILVLPAVKTEVDFPLPALLAELDAPDLTRHPDGTEEIAGLATTKYRIDHIAKDGSRADGYLWITRAGVLAKLDVAVTRAHGGRPMKIAMELSHVEPGPVDPALFQVPKDYSHLPADALGTFLGSAPAK